MIPQRLFDLFPETGDTVRVTKMNSLKLYKVTKAFALLREFLEGIALEIFQSRCYYVADQANRKLFPDSGHSYEQEGENKLWKFILFVLQPPWWAV